MNILVAVDDSDFADYVAAFVGAHQWPADAHFVVVHVLPSLLPVTAVLPAQALEDISEARRVATEKLLARVVSKFEKPGEVIDKYVAEGDPRNVILAKAHDIRADVIVMGSHGRTGLGRWMLGSVSLSVVSGAHCSVVIVRPPAPAAYEN